MRSRYLSLSNLVDWTVYVVAIGFVWDIPLKINFETCQSDQVHFLQFFFFLNNLAIFLKVPCQAQNVLALIWNQFNWGEGYFFVSSFISLGQTWLCFIGFWVAFLFSIYLKNKEGGGGCLLFIRNFGKKTNKSNLKIFRTHNH